MHYFIVFFPSFAVFIVFDSPWMWSIQQHNLKKHPFLKLYYFSYFCKSNTSSFVTEPVCAISIFVCMCVCVCGLYYGLVDWWPSHMSIDSFIHQHVHLTDTSLQRGHNSQVCEKTWVCVHAYLCVVTHNPVDFFFSVRIWLWCPERRTIQTLRSCYLFLPL